MKDQPKVPRPAGAGAPQPRRRALKRREAMLPGVMALALGLVALLWAVSHFSPEARIRRASSRIVRWTSKEAAESPVAAGLAANRFGALLTGDMQLEFDGIGTIASGRQPTVQLFAQVRATFTQMEFIRPAVSTRTLQRGEILAVVNARYRWTADGIAPLEGEGTAELVWRRTDEGWRIARAVLSTDQAYALPREWL